MSCADLINARLPDDLLAQVFHRVAAGGAAKRDLDRCALVCRRWLRVDRASRRAARVPVGGACADDVVRALAERFPGLTDVTIDQDLSVAAGAHTASAQRHRASNDESSSQSFTPAVGTQEAHSGDVMASHLTDSGLAHLMEGCKQLNKLTLNWCFYIGLVGIADNCQNLQSLELLGGNVQNYGLIALAEGCNLNELKLCGVQKLTDEGLVEYLKIRGRSLVSLDVSSCGSCMTDKSLHAIGSYCPNLEVLSVSSPDVKENKGIISVAKGCQYLKSLKLVRLGIDDEAFEAVGSFCSALEILTLDFLHCTDRGLSSIANGCKQLKKLTVNFCYFTDRSIELVTRNCIFLGHLNISRCQIMETGALEHIGRRCMNLSVLSLNGLRIENNAFVGFGRGCALLKSICLAMCNAISDEAICHIAQGCKNLTKFSGIYCNQIGDKAVMSLSENCKELRELMLRSLERLTDTGLSAIGQCCFLQKLDIRGCKQITDNGLTAITRDCHDLVHLDISDTMNIGDTTLAKVGEGCPKLKHLGMLRSKDVSDDGLAHIASGCTQLEVCEVVLCSRVTPTGVTTLAMGCSRLKRLVVEEFKVSEEAQRRAGSVLRHFVVEPDLLDDQIGDSSGLP